MVFLACDPNHIVWEKPGQDVYGSQAYDAFGDTLASSADGLTIAIGSETYDFFEFKPQGYFDYSYDIGKVWIFSYDVATKQWTQKGQDILGEAARDKSGISLSLSEDGNTVAIGATENDGCGDDNCGHVRIYSYSIPFNRWIQKKQTSAFDK